MERDTAWGTSAESTRVRKWGCVWEVTQSVSPRVTGYAEGMKAGMLMTDEPGFYDEKQGFGIRIENTYYILWV